MHQSLHHHHSQDELLSTGEQLVNTFCVWYVYECVSKHCLVVPIWDTLIKHVYAGLVCMCQGAEVGMFEWKSVNVLCVCVC